MQKNGHEFLSINKNLGLSCINCTNLISKSIRNQA